MDYEEFIRSKSQWSAGCGFRADRLPDWLYDFQRYLVEWSLAIGRGAMFADCGMGKTAMQLAWGDAIIKRHNKPVLIVTPLAVGSQTLAEAERFGIEAKRSRDGFFDGSKCIWVTNYEQLSKLNPADFAGVVADESSAIKDFKSERKGVVVEFMRTIQYRLLCTATPSPNDFWELGTSSEALGLLGFRDMITKFFKQETSKDHHGWGRTKYRFRGHAEKPFWSWVCSWARACRLPSDLGFDASRFVLPELIERQIVVEANKLRDGFLFSLPARDMREEREERRRTLEERCEKACEIATACDGPTVLWCGLNPEGELLRKIVPDSVEVSGSMSDDAKEEALTAFSTGQIKRLITKPVIGAWGLNWQHCSNVIAFPTHSFEQYYQLVRRCYRFGQKNAVTVSIVCSEGESSILQNLQRKRLQTEKMFDELVAHMNDSMRLVSQDSFPNKEQVPSWLLSTK
jgi:hypothetical protein